MSTKTVCLLVLLTLAVAALPAMAQDEKADSFVYATYFYCDVAGQERADEIVKANGAPVFDAAVADGTITGWGWLSHHTGGKWRRIRYHVAPSVEKLLETLESLNGKVAEKNEAAAEEFSQICGAHDDYIWQQKHSSGGLADQGRGTAGFSVYHVCKMSKESRADEIVEETLAPLFNAQVKAGNFSSWGWNTHVVGGKYRRLATYTAPSFDKLIAGRAAVIATLIEKHSDAADEFNSICTSHQDYMWNIELEKP